MDPANRALPTYDNWLIEMGDKFQDSVSYESCIKPVTQVCCGQTYDKSTLKEVVRIAIDKKIKSLCPNCQTPFEIIPSKNLAMIEIAQLLKKAPKSVAVENVVEVEKKDHTDEAEEHFMIAKEFVKNNQLQTAADMLGEVLDKSPNYKEAIGFNEAILLVLGAQHASKPSVEIKSNRPEIDLMRSQNVSKPSEIKYNVEMSEIRGKFSSYFNRLDRQVDANEFTIVEKIVRNLNAVTNLNENQMKFYIRFPIDLRSINNDDRIFLFRSFYNSLL